MTAQAPNASLRLTIAEDNAALARLLAAGQRLLAEHPQAARTLVQAFVAEGRRFAETAEGQAWKEALIRTDLIRRGRLIWEAYALDSLFESEPAFMPSAWLDVVSAASDNPDLETILSTLLAEEIQYGSHGPA